MKIAIIPARKGSKGIPNKNKKLLGSKPLIQYTFESIVPLKSEFEIYLTTDDEDIIKIAKSFDINIHRRSAKNASDTAPMRDVVNEVLESIEFNPTHILLLQPTSPFRTTQNIIDAIDMLDDQTEGVVSFKEVKETPEYQFVSRPNGYVDPFITSGTKITRRQDLPTYLIPNGAIYLLKTQVFKEQNTFFPKLTKAYVMSDYDSIDLDTEFDWIIAELIIETK